MEHTTDVPPWFLAAIVVGTQVVGKAGDVLLPALVHDAPRALLALNANDLHCILTARSLSFSCWFALALARRLAEDPVFFYVGWRWRDAGGAWLARYGVPPISRLGATSILVAVVVEPNAAVCALAGAARTRPTVFVVANVVGTVARLVGLRYLADRADARIDALLALARTYARGLLALTIVVAALPPLFTYRRRRRRRDSPEKEP